MRMYKVITQFVRRRGGIWLHLPMAIAMLGAGSSSAAHAQEVPLALGEAIARALEHNPSAEAARQAEEASRAQRSQAVSRFFPQVDYIESFNRSNNPVFVFGSLLNQGRFTEENFALDQLNHPDGLNNFRSQFVVSQPIFVGGQNVLGLEGARVNVDMAAEGKRLTDMQVIFETLRTYFGVQVSAENLQVIEKAVATAQADLSRAQALYDSGMVTESDLLAIRVHLAALRQQQIRSKNAHEIMKAELNQTLGMPLDSDLRLLTPLEYRETKTRGPGLEELIAEALENQPAANLKSLEVESMRLEKKKADYRFLPSVAFNAGWESDRQSFTGEGGTNWMLGVSLQLNLFQGLGKIYGSRAAAAALRKAEAEKKQALDEVRLEVRRAFLDREAATEQVDVAREAVSQARESHRITQARYEGGLADVTDLLRSQNALLQAEAQYLGAVYAGRLAEARLELAVGTLHKESEAVKP